MLSKSQFKNLCSSFRWMRRETSHDQALAWIEHWSKSDRMLLEKIYGPREGVTDSKTGQAIAPTLCGKIKDKECEMFPCVGCEAHEMIYQIEKDRQDASFDDMADFRLSERAKVGL